MTVCGARTSSHRRKGTYRQPRTGCAAGIAVTLRVSNFFSETTPRRPVQGSVKRRKAPRGDLIVTCHIGHLPVYKWPRSREGKGNWAVHGWAHGYTDEWV